MEVELHDSLSGQVALVTGATRGIGAVVAAELAELGAAVYAGARDPDDVNASELRPVRLDVTDDREIDAAIGRIADEAGRLDVVVNNAAIYGPEGPLHENPVDEIDAVLATDLRGPIVVTRRALPVLLDRRGGRVVNVSSGSGALTEGMSSGGGPYAISKTGLNGLTAYLDAEYGDDGLIANAVCPGWVHTDMGGEEAPRTPTEGAETPVWLSRFAPGSPSGRFWRDREIIEW